MLATDLEPYKNQRVRIGVPDDTGYKSTFNWYGVLLDVSSDRIKLYTDQGRTMFIRLDQILEFSTLERR